ncbi:hypothetical protein KCP69_01270 [Salmonella enterica subsp. enterica]|nr:hypothetical protein KCP69_01270 [Salmonella enterica subsp. enterica]
MVSRDTTERALTASAGFASAGHAFGTRGTRMSAVEQHIFRRHARPRTRSRSGSFTSPPHLDNRGHRGPLPVAYHSHLRYHRILRDRPGDGSDNRSSRFQCGIRQTFTRTVRGDESTGYVPDPAAEVRGDWLRLPMMGHLKLLIPTTPPAS